MNWLSEIQSAFHAISADPKTKDRLAYLMLTSKVEHPIRDQVALRLHQKHQKNYLIMREWKGKSNSRIDLAILDKKGNAVCLIEFKAHAAMKNIGQWRSALKEDLEKCRLAAPKAQRFFIMLANCIDDLPKEKINREAVKYADKLHKSLLLGYTAEKILEDWNTGLQADQLPPSNHLLTISAGKFYETSASLMVLVSEG